MILNFRHSFIGIRIFLSALAAFSFVSFATAIHNPEFHEKLHPLELHQAHEEISGDHDAGSQPAETKREKTGQNERKNQHAPGATCHFCNAQSHVATNLVSLFVFRAEVNPLPESIRPSCDDLNLLRISSSILGRAPPAAF
jgi:hypothetical protein